MEMITFLNKLIDLYFEIFHLIPWFLEKLLQTANIEIKRAVEHSYREWNMPSLRVSHSVSWKSFREMEKIDRIAQHGDYPTLLSYSPRKQAAACTRAQMHGYTVYQFAIQSSRSLECSLKLFHPNLVFTSFAQFRMDVYTYMYIFTIYVCVYVSVHIYIYIHPFPISLFRKSLLIHLAKKRGCRATEIRRLRGLVCDEM